MNIAMLQARKRLALVWFAGAGASFFVLLLISLFAQVDTTKLWDWYLPAITPNLSLIVGVLVHDLRKKGDAEENVDSFLYGLAFWLSALYVALLCLPLLVFPFTGISLPEQLDTSRLWLSPLQALATAALGAFYVRREGK